MVTPETFATPTTWPSGPYPTAMTYATSTLVVPGGSRSNTTLPDCTSATVFGVFVALFPSRSQTSPSRISGTPFGRIVLSQPSQARVAR